VAKKFLLMALQESEGLSWSDSWLQAIDLEYHNITPEQGMYFELLRQGSMQRFVTEEEIKNAIFAPPETTRAYFRGRSVAKFNDQIESIQWDEIVFGNGAHAQRIAFPEASTDDPRLVALNGVIRDTKPFAAFICRAAQMNGAS
jgi:hypothetical protein